ncbi:MAG: AEC family transporter [Succinivibrionaceae bacterium]
MSLSYMLAEQIGVLFIIIMMSIVCCKLKVFDEELAKKIAKLIIYLVCPCLIIISYQSSFNSDTSTGLLISAIAAIFCHLAFIVLSKVFNAFKYTDIEKANIIYSNSGNLTIPLVAAVFGTEMVMYASAYMAVQTFFIWTHGLTLVSGKKNFNLSVFCKNINIWAIAIGLICYFLSIPLPSYLLQAMQKVGNMIGALSMINIGIIIGMSNLLTIWTLRALGVACVRLILFPIIITFIYFGVSYCFKFSENNIHILGISLVSVAAPCAVSITQFAVLCEKDYKNSVAINIISTICCIITIPIIIHIYELLTSNI